MVRTQVVGGK
jgi:endoplasmic reticulum chaperone BiP